jgi:HK97 family phage major capsid protein
MAGAMPTKEARPTTARARPNRWWGALAIAALLAGCGGSKRGGDTAPTAAAASEGGSGEAAGGVMIPPEMIDEINRDLARKNPVVSRCLAAAVESRELPKNSSGKITLEIVITGNKATSVKIVRATLASKMLDDCVVRHVQEIEFPQLPGPFETSYTYGFEAM